MRMPSLRTLLTRRAGRIAGAAGLLVAGVLAAAPVSPAPSVPGRSWPTAKPSSVGLDAAELRRIADTARKGGSTCLTVVRRGRLAGEWSFRGTEPGDRQPAFSVTKSIASTLVGIAIDDGRLRLDDPASRWITEWRGTPSEQVTVRHLLSNVSGREWSPRLDYRELLAAPDKTAFAIGLGQTSAPGTVWAYNNSAIQTLERVLERATGRDVRAFAKERLFGPLGMRSTTIDADGAGNAQLFAGLRTTCRDLARFGLLVLRKGRWGERRIVSERWLDLATGRSSTEMNAAYGLLWWLNRHGHIAAGPLVATSLVDARSPTAMRGRLVPGAPSTLAWALGMGNQLVQVHRGTDTVVVRLGVPTPQPKPPTFGPKEASRVVTHAVVRR